jgi:hypothetical protein
MMRGGRQRAYAWAAKNYKHNNSCKTREKENDNGKGKAD